MTSSYSDRYRGFDLASVCWGYRDLFARTLEELFAEGVIGDDRPEVTDNFFALMRCADHMHFDYVLKEFLGSLNSQTAWMLDLPDIFAEVTEVGRDLAEAKLHYGVTYFRLLGQGGLGRTPREVRYALTMVKRLRAIDDDLAMAFLSHYKVLTARLTVEEIEVFVRQALEAFARRRDTGLEFMAGTLRTSELILQSITQEARLETMTPGLSALLRALVGYDVEISDLGGLDSDVLIERGTRVVCMTRWLYLPRRMRYFDTLWQNRNAYRFCGVVAAGMLSLNSFPRIQGHPDYATAEDLVGSEVLRLNLFQMLEATRVLAGIRLMWPGARRLVTFGLAAEQEALRSLAGSVSPAIKLFFRVVRDDALDRDRTNTSWAVVDELCRLSHAAINCFDTAALLKPDLLTRVRDVCPALASALLPAFTFLPDFLYPAKVSRPPPDTLVADLKDQARRRQAERDRREDGAARLQPAGSDTDEETEHQADRAVAVGYLYDEWSQSEQTYYPNHCRVLEKQPESGCVRDLPPEVVALARRTRRVFERLRPELCKEKYLANGDVINVDLLTDYLVQRMQQPAPPVNFYEKPYHGRRDLATLILLDVSGSTGSEVRRDKTIELEKRAALTLGHGLAALGDRFALCGFSGNGREQCEFFVYKDLDMPWGREAVGRVMAAYPRNATRIGAALRHAGYRLAVVPARQRLILLLTDGQPMDSGYDPTTRYAQYDVRMACHENERQGIHTFCISTDDNSRADMEIMFPHHRYVILPEIAVLPRLLPQLYVQLTT